MTSHETSRLFGVSVLTFATLFFSSQLALAQFSQQGPKLVGTFAVGDPEQGFSVALSADGNTAIVGGPWDNSQAGAAWVYILSGGVWTQQGSKLVPTDPVGPSQYGGSVAFSADGNTAIVGGALDNSGTGAAWVFTRSGGLWAQQGSKLVGIGTIGGDYQGISVALLYRACWSAILVPPSLTVDCHRPLGDFHAALRRPGHRADPGKRGPN